jgi:hypothetical protein
LTGGSPIGEPARDLARGWRVVGFWGGPVMWILTWSFAGARLGLPSWELGALLVVGTVWLGSTCLGNALRCGRTHCFIDGVALPALAVVGAVSLLGVFTFAWSSYTSVLWIIVALGFVIECCAGSYLPRRTGGLNLVPPE